VSEHYRCLARLPDAVAFASHVSSNPTAEILEIGQSIDPAPVVFCDVPCNANGPRYARGGRVHNLARVYTGPLRAVKHLVAEAAFPGVLLFPSPVIVSLPAFEPLLVTGDVPASTLALLVSLTCDRVDLKMMVGLPPARSTLAVAEA